MRDHHYATTEPRRRGTDHCGWDRPVIASRKVDHLKVRSVWAAGKRIKRSAQRAVVVQASPALDIEIPRDRNHLVDLQCAIRHQQRESGAPAVAYQSDVPLTGARDLKFKRCT